MEGNTLQPPAIENLSKEERELISKGLILFLQKELTAMEESCPNPSQPTNLYSLDTLIKIANQRGYLNNEIIEEYSSKRNFLMRRYSDAEGV